MARNGAFLATFTFITPSTTAAGVTTRISLMNRRGRFLGLFVKEALPPV